MYAANIRSICYTSLRALHLSTHARCLVLISSFCVHTIAILMHAIHASMPFAQPLVVMSGMRSEVLMTTAAVPFYYNWFWILRLVA